MWKQKLLTLNRKELFKAIVTIYSNPLSNDDFREKFDASRDEIRAEIFRLLGKYYPTNKTVLREAKKRYKRYEKRMQIRAVRDFTQPLEEFLTEIYNHVRT